MNTDVMFSSKLDSWATPQDFFNKLNEVYNFDIDVCAAEDTAKCERYFTKENSCLDKDWGAGNVCFMNPPYGRQIGVFVKNAYDQSLKGVKTVCLLPARTDTKWFHDYCVKGEIQFLKGRLKFGTDEYWQWIWEQEFLPDKNGKLKKNSLYGKIGIKNSAPFPSMVVIFKNK